MHVWDAFGPLSLAVVDGLELGSDGVKRERLMKSAGGVDAPAN